MRAKAVSRPSTPSALSRPRRERDQDQARWLPAATMVVGVATNRTAVGGRKVAAPWSVLMPCMYHIHLYRCEVQRIYMFVSIYSRRSRCHLCSRLLAFNLPFIHSLFLFVCDDHLHFCLLSALQQPLSRYSHWRGAPVAVTPAICRTSIYIDTCVYIPVLESSYFFLLPSFRFVLSCSLRSLFSSFFSLFFFKFVVNKYQKFATSNHHR